MNVPMPIGTVDLYWLPLGAGDRFPIVRWSGRAFESLAARRQHRERCDLYHAALEIQIDDQRYVVEMTPAWGAGGQDRGTVTSGPVGLRVLGRSKLFRYEIHRWRDGSIPDIEQAVEGAHQVTDDVEATRTLFDLVPAFPTATWGRDELETGDMWNSNSLVAWLLAKASIDIHDVRPPPHGRAPGWSAGLEIATRRGDADPRFGATASPVASESCEQDMSADGDLIVSSGELGRNLGALPGARSDASRRLGAAHQEEAMNPTPSRAAMLGTRASRRVRGPR